VHASVALPHKYDKHSGFYQLARTSLKKLVGDILNLMMNNDRKKDRKQQACKQGEVLVCCFCLMGLDCGFTATYQRQNVPAPT